MDDEREIEAVLSGICSDERVQKMKEFVQHGKVSTYEHCKSVAKLSYKINKNLRLKSDLKVLLTGAMLHDFYLYDWHDFSDKSHSLHGIKHAERASRNAEKYFGVDKKTSRVIYCHMWPFNPLHLPTSREAWIVCVADKCAALYETLFRRRE